MKSCKKVNSDWNTSKLNGVSEKFLYFSLQPVLEKELEMRGKYATE